MISKNNSRSKLLVGSLLLLGSLSQSTQSFASGSLVIRNDGRHGRYTEVVVGSDRYYYNQGVYYTGTPGNYVIVDAPVGAVIYRVPYGYERVWIDGNVYYRYQDVYYRPNNRGYEVVRVDRSREWERGHGQRNNRWRNNNEHNEHNEHR